MKENRNMWLTGLLLLALPMATLAQEPTKPPTDTTGKKEAPHPPAGPGRARGNSNNKGPKPYAEVITEEAISRDGLFKVHKVDDKYYFEIPDGKLGRDILVVSRIAKAAADGRSSMMGYAGDFIGDKVIRFEKGPGDKIFLRSVSFTEMSSDSSENGMYHSVLNSNLQPIVAIFDIKAFSPDSTGSVIDVTAFIDGDNDILGFDSRYKKQLGLNNALKDRSYVDTVKAFPMNIEVRTVKTYMKSASPMAAMMGRGGASEPATYELNSSLVELPEKPMQPRYFDPRVGYFATGYVDFDADPQGVKRVAMITRWRLEPRPEDVEKYKRGVLVEPQKPIVFYIDPATPKKWVPYLIQGVNDWQKAFEQAGFKNAIIAKEAPANDSTWSLEDARHNVIVYKPSDIPNASGPHVHDPRTGEILETHVNWYHNVMKLIHDWYFIQTAAVDKRARKMEFSDELMGQLIRFVSSHEVGHTLGLRHNFGSSSTVPVEKLRDKKWLKEHGHTPSIMDYARFNYVAQPEDNIPEDLLFPRIGEYDDWAIEWGYKWLPQYKSAEKEEPYLNKWIIERLNANPRLWFGTESDPFDPRCQSEQIGDDAMVANTYGIENLKRILPNLVEWTRVPNEDYSNLSGMYAQLLNQFSRYMGHVSKYIGGIETTPKTVEQAGPVYAFVTKADQKEAMTFLQKQLFTTPTWLLDRNIFTLVGKGDAGTISSLQGVTLSRLMNPSIIGHLLDYETFDPAGAYSAVEMMDDLKNGIWSELTTHQPIDIYRRNLQKMYVTMLTGMIEKKQPAAQSSQNTRQSQSASAVTMTDVMSIAKGEIRSLDASIKAALPSVTDAATRMHLQDVEERLSKALDEDE